MKSTKWLLINIFFTILFLLIIISLNFYIDTYATRLSLFGIKKEISQMKFMAPINQYIFKTEYIFRDPNRFDSFIFGSSRTGSIDPAKINSGKFYNMSYSLGLPSHHLAIIKAFLQKGVKIKTVIIGLDDFSFNLSPKEHEKQLERIMHPSITGRLLSDVFCTYYFRVPKLFELANGIKLLFNNEQGKKLFILNEKGLYMFWVKKEKEIELLGKPLFTTNIIQVSQKPFDKKLEDEAFVQIQELILLAKKNNFRLIIFFNPISTNLYMSPARSLFPVKQKLALLTDYYDFSGLNSVTLNNLNFYEESHYRYLVGDMIIEKIFSDSNINVPGDFGVLVTKKNVNEHIQKQKRELEKYLVNKEMVQ
jgi:hypothetical protein